MDLDRARAAAARLEWLPSTPSTNDALIRHATGPDASAWPHLSVLATDTQTAGRGRLGRVWTAPPGGSLAASVLVRPALPVAAYGWLPLAAGLAMTETLRELGADAELKWPNDVLIGGRKVCGILAELLPDATGVVLGSGVNLDLAEEELPVPTATSLRLAGVATTADAVLAGYLRRLGELVDRLVAAGGDAQAAGLAAAVAAGCETIGRAVRIELPSRDVLIGTATGLDADGRLLVDSAVPGNPHDIRAVAAGDVTHLRY